MTVALQLVATHGFALPHRKLGPGEPIAVLHFAEDLDAKFFIRQLRWSAFKFEPAVIAPAEGVPADHLIVPKMDVEAGIEALRVLDLLRKSVAEHGPSQILIPTKEGEALPKLDPALADVVEVHAVEVREMQVGKIDLIACIANADAKELAAIKGIGPKAAEKLIENCQAHIAANPPKENQS